MDTMSVVPGVHLGLMFTLLVLVPIFLIKWRFITETLKPGLDVKEEGERSRRKPFLSQVKSAPRQIWVLLVVAILSSFGFQVFWSYVVVYSIEVLVFSKMQWSIASIASNLVAACFMMPSGFLSDRARRKPYIVLSQLLVSLGSLGYVFSTSFYGLVFTRIVGGVGEGLGGNVMGSVGGPVWQALVTDVAPAEFRGSILGLMGTFTGFFCTPAPLVGGFLYENVSSQSPFFMGAALGLLGSVIFTIFVKEPERLPKINSSEEDTALSS